MAQVAAHLSRIVSFEQLGEVVAGVQREIVQLERGPVRGELFQGSIGGLGLNLVTFNLGVRSRGATDKSRTAFSLLLECRKRVTRSSYESRPGDVLVSPPGGENENRYYGGATVLAMCLSPAEIELAFGPETRLSEPENWRKSHYKGSDNTVKHSLPWLQSFIARLGRHDLSMTPEAIEFWKLAAIEAVTADISQAASSHRDGPLPSALKLVRQTEEYLDGRPNAPVHIAQICHQLRISRRTLHRAFHEALGIGPIAFFRYRRLCATHTAIRTGLFADLTISEVAMQHGFLNEGRFAHYYHQLFGEYPSETRLFPGAPCTIAKASALALLN
jgi:AraC-like DNA-binding protein